MIPSACIDWQFANGYDTMSDRIHAAKAVGPDAAASPTASRAGLDA